MEGKSLNKKNNVKTTASILSDNNYLKICEFFAVRVYDFKIVKFYLNLSKPISLSLIIYQTYVFLKQADIKIFMRHGPFYFIMIYVFY